MQDRETSRKTRGAKQYQSVPFLPVKDSRHRKVRGLWKRGERFYLQMRVQGERSARKIPLEATSLEAAKEEAARVKLKHKDEGLPSTGIRPVFSDYCQEYLSLLKATAGAGKRMSTVMREETSLEQWKRIIGHIRLDKITKPLIVRFTEERLKSGVTPRTVNLDVIVLRNVLSKARDAGWIERLPTEGVKMLATKSEKQRLMSGEEFNALCLASRECGKNGAQLEDYLRFLAFTGARCAEALMVRWEHIDFGRKQVLIGAGGSAKNGEERHIDMNPKLRAHLTDMMKRRAPDSAWLFPSPLRGENDRPAKSLRESFRKACKAAGVDRPSFHALRHYFISMAVMSGIDFKTVAEWVGHKDGGVLIGNTYAHLSADHRKRMAQKLFFEIEPIRSEAVAMIGGI